MAWKIKNIIPMVDIDERGRFVKIYRITYTIDNKYEDWVDVPADKYDPDYVKKLLDELEKKHKALLGE